MRTWSVPAELYKFHLARAHQLSLGQPIPLYMLWYCVLMCLIQHGGEVPVGWRTVRSSRPGTRRIGPRLHALH